ncbi:hypothetical protein GQF42_19610 [Streptomyces broussonetiae]|uniref:Uncharacterized protein n=3 Tax=Streptomyces broussonetiae TaxID=2686304 RepID=A0A6I6NA46_9ACTN|nr:hypothetical protein [Streptomyces broussonetiae]QHA05206.1 hypothetical protein GQF42_19610 [Streptomyces broussonetiae]
MADSFHQALMTADLTVLDKLADRWDSIHTSIKGLGKRLHDEVLTPLRDKGYWEGAAAPYAWKMIDDIQRQLEHATSVADASRRVIEDAVGDLKSAQKDLKDAVRRATDKGLYIQSDGTPAPDVTGGVCKANPTKDDKKDIEAARHEIAEILKRGVTADRNLAFSLMADIGLGPWFNDRPGFTDIDSTGRIGEDEYNALDLAMQGKNPYPASSSDDPYSLGWDWVTGDGPRHREYFSGDRMTELIRSSESMQKLRVDTLQQWRSTGQPEGDVAYSISSGGKVGALEKLITTDLPAIVTGDKAHLGEAFTGSYNLHYDVKGEDPDGSVVVEYTLHNTTSNESFLHYIGYYDWLKETNRDHGVFSSEDQKIVWTERIPAKEK